MSMFEYEGLKISVEEVSGSMVIDWTGESDTRDPASNIGPYLSELASRLHGKTVRLRFDGLQYMNSSTVTPIMKFVRELSAVANRVTVHYDESVQWQATSFRAMRVVARRWPNVEVVGLDSPSRRSGRPDVS